MIEYIATLPEIFVMMMICVTLLAGVFFSKQHPLAYYLAQLTLVMAAGLTIYSFGQLGVSSPVYVFSRTFVFDNLSVILKLFVYLMVFITFLYSRVYNEVRKLPSNEFYVLGLLSVLGMMMLISGSNLITLYLGLELFSLPTYAMVALQREKECCIEAAMKYFIIGSVASGFLLYGFSMIFGATQSLDISTIAQAISHISVGQHYMLTLGLVFIVAAVAFKLGAAPFHQWVPDVYEGAPTSVTLFIGVAPKLAAFGLAIRLLVYMMPSLSSEWQQIIIIMAILSMAIGNFTAIVQTNIKRMLAYSSIAHIGYMLLALACATNDGNAAALFYMISYCVMTLGAFGVVVLLAHSESEAEDITDFAGLSTRHPWFAFVMLLLMFSMAGVPPIVGFIAKVGILEALISVHLTWLAIVALFFAIVGAYYYLHVVKVMYFDKAPEDGLLKTTIATKPYTKIVLSINGIAVVLMGMFPRILFSICHSIF